MGIGMRARAGDRAEGMIAAARYVAIFVAAASLGACGDGTPTRIIGGDGTGGGGWEPGVFGPASSFQARCKMPRSGTNPATNRAYPDVQGTVDDENGFLRSYSNDTYLWYSEIIDQDPGLFGDPILYFDKLKTDAVTASGQPKDRFHFSVDTEAWFNLSQSGVAEGYGAQWVFLSVLPPRQVLVAYTEPGSPATSPLAGLARGARVLEVDGVDIDSDTQAGIDAINAGLFPSGSGETHAFVVRDLGSPTPRTITMTSEAVESEPVKNVRVLDTPSGRVGYMLFNDHIATAELGLINAVNQLEAGSGVDDLVLDIRYNGGGFLSLASQLAYMIAGRSATDGRTFELTQFNDKHPDTDPVTGRSISPTPFYDETLGSPFNAPTGQALPTLALPRVFVLTSSSTCSASESIINGLRGVDVEVIQIGTTTCGKPYGFYPRDNCGTTYFTIQFRGVNDRGFGDYPDGFSPANAPENVGVAVPGCWVMDDFTAGLGDPSEARLSAALRYRDTQTCPSIPALAAGMVRKSGPGRTMADGFIPKSPWNTNRIMLP